MNAFIIFAILHSFFIIAFALFKLTIIAISIILKILFYLATLVINLISNVAFYVRFKDILKISKTGTLTINNFDIHKNET